MTSSLNIAPCPDCGAQTETTAGGTGRCGPCQYPIDRPPPPPSTPLRTHRSGRLVPACRRCRHNRPMLGDPLAWCARCGDPEPTREPPPVEPATGPACITCGQRLLLIRPNRDVCERCRLDANQTPDATPAPDGNSPRTERPAGGTDTTKEIN